MSQLSQIDDIISGNNGALQNFISMNNQTFVFTNLNCNDYRKNLWNVLFKNLQKDIETNLSLSALRILSRDKTEINEIITEERFKLLLKFANLDINDGKDIEKQSWDIILESLKCLCNILFNSTTAQELCSKNNMVECIINRLRSGEQNIPKDIKYFDMKLLFLITALNTNSRSYLRDFNGLTYLTDSIEEALHEFKTDNNSIKDIEGQLILSDNYVAFICEVLKILFNITIKNSEVTEIEKSEEIQYKRLVTLLRDLLLIPTKSTSKKQELQSHIINLLTCVPQSSYIELCPKLNKEERNHKNMKYEDRNIEAAYELLKYLKWKLELQPNAVGQQEALSPILSTLTRSIRSVRFIRKYVRMQILPPLKDVHKRPEQGNTLRNYLCRLLTTPCSHVRDLTADFIFVLCKENVARMIKYTGYGNAAGLFATRGLMDGRNCESQFSSESEDSDTEIYKEYRHGINPVIGCYEKPHTDPTAHMTEEQKEYEALQLVNLIDKLTRSGTIQPCRIGEDGRPEPVEHVLQLQEKGGSLFQQITKNDDDD